MFYKRSTMLKIKKKNKLRINAIRQKSQKNVS